MNAIIKNKAKDSANTYSTILKKSVASVGLFLGFILLITGVFLIVFAFFEKTNFDNAELLLILASFVLFGLGAHCLDLLEKEKRANRDSL